MSEERRRSSGRQGSTTVSRRGFLTGALAGAAFSVVPSSVLAGGGGTSPSDKMNIAGVGVGGMGGANVQNSDSQNIVALCDVDSQKAKGIFNKYPDAKVWTDYREMLAQQDEIDAVIVGTPDHTHAVITAAAMKAGKHVYTQKPLTHSVWEARQLRKIAHETGVTTQMGNQGHSNDSVRRCREWVETGAIGTVREVHCWTNRPIWPQGEVDNPEKPVPDHLDWDLWLGPAEKRPYSPVYHPFKWRGWQDFGTGAFGDMGCHIMDMPFYALDLGHPVHAEASTTQVFPETYPEQAIVTYKFPPRNGKPGITFKWYSGGLKPAVPDAAPADTRLGSGGCILVGDDGALISGSYGSDARVYPLSRMQDLKDVPKKYPRVTAKNHEMAWIEAAKKGEQPAAHFDYATRLTETVLLGNVAILSGKPLKWDAENLRVTNVPEANKYVRWDYRDGWSL